MRIISKFHDYYDSAIGYGIDEAVTYVRKSVEFDRNEMRAGYEPQTFKSIAAACEKVAKNVRRVRGQLFEHVYMGFCGKIYVGLQYAAKSDDLRKAVPTPYSPRYNMPIGMGCDQTQLVQAWVEKDFPDEELDAVRGKESRWGYGADTLREWFRVNRFNMVHENTDIFADNQCVSFVLSGRQLILEPRLADWRFQRRMDSFTAFQEISMFISGVLGSPDRCAPEPITDELRAHTKGFDKRSFRKDPTKRK